MPVVIHDAERQRGLGHRRGLLLISFSGFKIIHRRSGPLTPAAVGQAFAGAPVHAEAPDTRARQVVARGTSASPTSR